MQPGLTLADHTVQTVQILQGPEDLAPEDRGPEGLDHQALGP